MLKVLGGQWISSRKLFFYQQVVSNPPKLFSLSHHQSEKMWVLDIEVGCFPMGKKGNFMCYVYKKIVCQEFAEVRKKMK